MDEAMETISYAATVREFSPGDFEVRFADVPEALTFGSSVQEALENAPDCLAVAIEHYLEMGREMPVPRPAADGEYSIALDPEIAARAILIRAMRDQKLTNVALAQRMNRDEKAVRRVLSGKQASFSLILDALKAVGVRPALSVPSPNRGAEKRVEIQHYQQENIVNSVRHFYISHRGTSVQDVHDAFVPGANTLDLLLRRLAGAAELQSAPMIVIGTSVTNEERERPSDVSPRTGSIPKLPSYILASTQYMVN